MKIALLGFGTVGSGVYEAASAYGAGVSIAKILVRHPREGFEKICTTDFSDILNDSSIELVAEAMGGDEPAFSYLLAALKAKKHVVTANKLVVSAHYSELHAAAREAGVSFSYTAAAGGGIPWLYNLARVCRCDRVLAIEGIINGTTNFILDGMHSQRADFNAMLCEAQRLGYAEKDPSADIDALDTVRKCALSASVAFSAYVAVEKIPFAGIRKIERRDIEYAERLGCAIRLMFFAQRAGGGICASAVPAFVGKSSPAAGIHGCYNMVSLKAERLGELTLIGQGAGKEPTGESVFQDILDIAFGRALPNLSTEQAALCPDAQKRRYYIRKGEEQRVTAPLTVSEALACSADFFARIEE